jgi:hypothetical protein
VQQQWLIGLVVVKTFEKELLTDSLSALRPLERVGPEGEAAADEVKKVVANRSGIILSASTILKSDFFSNLQKMSLPEYAYLEFPRFSALTTASKDVSKAHLTSGGCHSHLQSREKGSLSPILKGRWRSEAECRLSTGKKSPPFDRTHLLIVE